MRYDGKECSLYEVVKIKEKLKTILIEAIKEIGIMSINEKDVSIEVPKKKEYGDFTTNIAMKLAGKLSSTPKELGEEIKDRLSLKCDFLDEIKIMGSGFINFYIKEDRFIRDSLKTIESGDFKNINLKAKNTKLVMILENIQEIFTLENFRTFINMYYLGNLYSFAGINIRRKLLVKDYEVNLNINYLLSNFKGIEITQDKNELKDSIIFCHTLNQDLFKDISKNLLIVEGVKVLKNGFEVNDITSDELLEALGLDRVKYTLCNKAMSSEGIIEFTKDELRYIMYPYSRIGSIINIFKNEGLDIDNIHGFKVDYLNNQLEKEMVKKILEFKEAVINAVFQNQPYKFIKYANELCKLFYKINDTVLYRRLSREKLIPLLKLLSCFRIVLKEILTILELPALEKM